MQELEHHISPKIALIGLGVLGLVIAVLLVFSLRGSRAPKTNTDKTAVNPSPANTDVTPRAEIPTTPTPIPSLYKDDVVSVDYPDDWTYVVNNYVNNSGKGIYFKPKSVSDDTTVPSYYVSYDTATTPLADRVKDLEFMGLKRSGIVIDGIRFVRDAGTSQDRVENNDLVEKPTQVSYAYAYVNGKTLLVKYLYDGKSVDPKMEEVFRNLMLKTHFTAR